MGIKQLNEENLIIKMLLFLQKQVVLALKVISYLIECSYNRIQNESCKKSTIWC